MNRTRIIIVLLVFPSSLNSIKVFEFIENDEKSPSTIEMEVSLPEITDNITICSSHKQLQSNHQSLRVYTIYEDAAHNHPWLGIGFWGRELWAELNMNDWIKLNTIDAKVDFINWVHICININFSKSRISSALNGDVIEIRSLLDIPKPSKIYFR